MFPVPRPTSSLQMQPTPRRADTILPKLQSRRQPRHLQRVQGVPEVRRFKTSCSAQNRFQTEDHPNSCPKEARREIGTRRSPCIEKATNTTREVQKGRATTECIICRKNSLPTKDKNHKTSATIRRLRLHKHQRLRLCTTFQAIKPPNQSPNNDETATRTIHPANDNSQHAHQPRHPAPLSTPLMPPLTIISRHPDVLTNRPDELLRLLNQFRRHVLCLQETRLKPGVNCNVRGYFTYRTDPPKDRGGGTAILVQDDIPAQQIAIKTEEIEHTTVTIFLQDHQLNVSSTYAPTGKLTPQDLRAIVNRPEQTILIVDLNARHKSAGSAYTSKNGTVLFSPFSESANLLIPPEPTHQHHCRKYQPAILIMQSPTSTYPLN